MFVYGGKEMKISVRDTQETPMPWGGKLVFHNCIVGGSIDARFLPAILKGIMEKMEEGPLDRFVCPRHPRLHLRR